jgi:hypothetical protein
VGKGKRGTGLVAKVIEHVEAHYEMQNVEMGTVYRWCPESAVVECEECAEEVALTASKTTCLKCGVDCASTVEEVLDGPPEDDGDRPWRSLRPYYHPTRGT